MTISIKLRLAILAAASVFALGSVQATEVTGAGSSFVYPVLSKWSVAFHSKTANQINYQSIGSGGGIAQIKAATVDFGASDAPLSQTVLHKFGLGQFPLVIGGIVPVVHLAGIKAGQMRLTGPVLAAIFMGKITRWNDPILAKLNPGIKLPNAVITVIHRSDGSGTTYNFTNYLSKVSADWKNKIGFATSVPWPAGVGGKGNEGVSAYVEQIKNSIGYVEYAYALQNQMSYTQLQNSTGRFIEPNNAAFSAAAATADWAHAKNFHLLMTNAPGAKAWPIAATTWAIMYKKPKNAAHAKTAFKFFKWAFEHGQALARSLDYVPLPPSLVKQIEAYWVQQFKM